MNIIIAILVFSVIIIIHELGHFLLAKKNGIGVIEFSLGMGPRLITVVKTERGMSLKFLATSDDCMNREDWKDRTKYSWKLLPIGGSCMMLGEDEVVDSEKSFDKKGVWARISVIFAGPFFNFILAFILALIIMGAAGYDPARILTIEEGSAMQEAGFEQGDVVTKINKMNVHFSREMMMDLQVFNPLDGAPVNITVNRDGEKLTKAVTPRLDDKGVYKLGFSYNMVREKTDTLGVLKNSVYEVKYWIVTTVKSLGQLITGKVKMDDLAGPVGIVNMIGDTVNESKSQGFGEVTLQILNISLLLTANLGVMNLLPIPALDGGRLLFLFIEAIRGKPVKKEREAMVHFVGLVLLMLLMVFVLFNDVGRIVRG